MLNFLCAFLYSTCTVKCICIKRNTRKKMYQCIGEKTMKKHIDNTEEEKCWETHTTVEKRCMNKRVDNSQWEGFSLLVHRFPGRHGIISTPFPTNITRKGAITNVTRRFFKGNLKRVSIMRLNELAESRKSCIFSCLKQVYLCKYLKSEVTARWLLIFCGSLFNCSYRWQMKWPYE